MFKSTRLKLTAWYLVIIMFISVAFSFFIYRVLTGELSRIQRAQEFRVRHQDPMDVRLFRARIAMSPQIFEEAQARILGTLVVLNVIILVGSGAAGYFLAGRTLRPIKEMIDEQNRFIADASHELRTPITSLKSEIEVYLRGKHHAQKEADELLTSNLEEVNRLQELSDDLLQLAQYQNLNDSMVFEVISLRSVLEVAQRRVGALAKQKRIVIEEQINDYTLKADKQNLIELFVILIDNAIKYSSSGSIIKLMTKKTDHSILVNVVDNGIGIEKSKILHIFDRFYRVDTARTKQTNQGYGLGLSIAKKIVEAHKGSISIKSELRKGSTFTVLLPYWREG